MTSAALPALLALVATGSMALEGYRVSDRPPVHRVEAREARACGEDETCVVPFAVRRDARGEFVLVAEGDRIVRKDVVTITRGVSLVSVSGMKAGDLAIFAGSPFMKENDRCYAEVLPYGGT